MRWFILVVFLISGCILNEEVENSPKIEHPKSSPKSLLPDSTKECWGVGKVVVHAAGERSCEYFDPEPPKPDF